MKMIYLDDTSMDREKLHTLKIGGQIAVKKFRR